MCDTCDRLKKELVNTKKTIDALTKDKDVKNPINIDMLKTEKSMCYERLREIMKKASKNS